MTKKSLLLLLLGCMTSLVWADPIGPSQALKIAAAYIHDDVSVSYAIPFRRSATRGVTEGDTLAPLYIISRGSDAGFVIVSGDNSLPEVIGYTESGDFVEDDMPPALLDMLQGYVRIIEEAQEAGAPARAPQRAAAERVTVKPLIQAHWHQTAPYNNLAPFIKNTENHAVTGCTCTAAVMVLHYFRRDLPDQLLATTPTYSYGDAPVTVSYPKGTPIQWDLMLNSYNSSYPAEMGNAVAVLNAAFGAGIWQTYGNSTSGQISNIVDGYRNYFNLSSTCQYQGGMSQTSWENIIYKNLANKQPMVYAGVHASEGGHAIILDGYNANNGLYHFNFGWGGQGDGYYTLDAKTGINGFAGEQGMVYNIAPKQPKITAKMYVDAQTVKRAETTIRVTATNMGTLDYSGFNFYWGTSDRKPSSSASVSANDNTLTLASDESGEFSVSFKPTLDKTYYIYLTDKHCNVLDRAVVEVVPTDTKLTLEALDISASNNVEEHTSGTYRLLYNTELIATATLLNSAKGTKVQPGFRLTLMNYNEETDSLEKVRYVTMDDYVFAPGERKELSAKINRITTGKRYALIVNSEITGVDNDKQLQLATNDTIFRFKVCAPTLDTLHTREGVMTLQGDWDPMCFTALATDPTVVGYDLTQVKGVNSQPIAANPNALFYTATDVEGYNIVYQNHIRDLQLQDGYNFVSQGTYTATKATFTPRWNVAQWNTLTLPFTAMLPEGYICRRPTELSKSSISAALNTDTLLAGTPYLLMADTHSPSPITADNVTIDVQATTAGITEFHPVLSETVADAQTLVLDLSPDASQQYFSKVDSGTVLSAFTGVLKVDARRIRATLNSTSEQAYKSLAEAIDQGLVAYDEMHTAIEPEWNALLLDSIAIVRDIYAAMQLTKVSDIKQIASDLLSLVEIYKLQLMDKSQPIDYTGYISNPSFETGKKDGWTLPSNVKICASSILSTYAVGADGQYHLYNETTEGATAISQTIENLPTGYYRLTAMVGTNDGGVVSLFAGDSTVHVAAHEWGRFYLTEGVVDSVWVENGALTIGVHEGATWYKADDFKLYYLGDGNDDTRIDVVESAPTAIGRKGIYDLFGRRLNDRSQMLPGRIYIVDGRKMVCPNI